MPIVRSSVKMPQPPPPPPPPTLPAPTTLPRQTSRTPPVPPPLPPPQYTKPKDMDFGARSITHDTEHENKGNWNKTYRKGRSQQQQWGRECDVEGDTHEAVYRAEETPREIWKRTFHKGRTSLQQQWGREREVESNTHEAVGLCAKRTAEENTYLPMTKNDLGRMYEEVKPQHDHMDQLTMELQSLGRQFESMEEYLSPARLAAENRRASGVNAIKNNYGNYDTLPRPMPLFRYNTVNTLNVREQETDARRFDSVANRVNKFEVQNGGRTDGNRCSSCRQKTDARTHQHGRGYPFPNGITAYDHCQHNAVSTAASGVTRKFPITDPPDRVAETQIPLQQQQREHEGVATLQCPPNNNSDNKVFERTVENDNGVGRLKKDFTRVIKISGGEESNGGSEKHTISVVQTHETSNTRDDSSKQRPPTCYQEDGNRIRPKDAASGCKIHDRIDGRNDDSARTTYTTTIDMMKKELTDFDALNAKMEKLLYSLDEYNKRIDSILDVSEKSALIGNESNNGSAENVAHEMGEGIVYYPSTADVAANQEPIKTQVQNQKSKKKKKKKTKLLSCIR